MVRLAIPLLAGALLFGAAPAAAQEAPPPTSPPPSPPPPSVGGDSFTIGLGAGIVPSYEGSDDYRIIPGGVVRGKVSGFNFYTRGLQFYLDLVPEAEDETLDLSLGPVVGLRLNRTSSIKDVRVRALGELDEAYEVGGFAGIGKTGVITSAFDNLSFRVAYLKDVGGAHEIHVITPSIE